MLVLVFFITSLIIVPNDLLINLLLLPIVLIGYPYFIDYIVRWIKWLFMSIYSNLPKNVYNDL